MSDGATAQYGPLMRLRFHVPGTMDPPQETSPLPIPAGDWGYLLFHLPETEQPALREAFKRLLATDRAWTNDAYWIHNRRASKGGREKRWSMGPHAPKWWFSMPVVRMQDGLETAWNLQLKTANYASALPNRSDAYPLQEVVPNATRDEGDHPGPYSGCQSIIIHRDHLERLGVLAQHTLGGRLRTGYSMLFGHQNRKRPRSVAREIAQRQLQALADIHENLPADQIEHIPDQPLELLFATEQ